MSVIKKGCKKVASKSNNLPRKIGYARVSTADQNPDMQIAALKKYGVEANLIFVDHASGATMERPAFIRALKYAQHPDTEFVVWKLDRLGRTVAIILETIDLLAAREVKFVSLTEHIDTSTPMGKAFLHMAALMAQLERDLISERTVAGMARARERGIKGGRPVSMTDERIAKAEEMLGKQMRGNQVWAELRQIDGPPISRAAYYKWQREWDRLNKTADLRGESN